jgi:hypothetical protein
LPVSTSTNSRACTPRRQTPTAFGPSSGRPGGHRLKHRPGMTKAAY